MIIGSVGLTFTNFSMRNFFNWESYRPLPQGDGQTLSLKAQTNGKYYTSFSVSFREPWLEVKTEFIECVGLLFPVRPVIAVVIITPIMPEIVPKTCMIPIS